MNRETRRSQKTSKVSLAPQPASTAPRSMQDIDIEYAKLCGEAGVLQYNLEVTKANLQQLNLKISRLGEEAQKRRALDVLNQPTPTPETSGETANA